MGEADYLSKGDYNVQCDICDKKVKNSKTTMVKASILQDVPCWKVCRQCAHKCNEQELVKGIADKQIVPIPRPDSSPVFVDTSIIKTWEDY